MSRALRAVRVHGREGRPELALRAVDGLEALQTEMGPFKEAFEAA